MKYSPEMCILKLFAKDREAFENFYDQIKAFKYEVEIKTLLTTIYKYYDTYDNHMYIGEEELKTYYNTIYSIDKNKETIYTIIDTIYRIDVSDSIIKDLVKNLIEKDISLSIIEKLTSVISENKYGILSTVTDDVAKYDLLLQAEEPENIFLSTDLEAYLEEEKNHSQLRWRLKCLQEDLKNIEGGTLGHVFARPETGKTSFIVSEITYITRQLLGDECALWCNNEQAGKKIITRLYTTMLNRPEEQIINSIHDAKIAYQRMSGDRLKIYDNVYMSIEGIRKLIRNFNPRFVVVDQGDKVTFQGASKLEGHARLKELYVRFRELAKEFNTHILTVGQASSEAAGRKWLEMHHMDNSKTGKPGEMDYIIGIGKPIGEGDDDGLRYINLCKNKQTGKHSRHVVKLDGAIGRYTDV